MRYVITYDLNRPSHSYAALWKALDGLEAVPVLRSQWAINSANMTAADLRDHLRQFIEAGDALLVMSLNDAEWAGINLQSKLDAL